MTPTEVALTENLVSKDHVETLTEFEAKVDQAKMKAVREGQKIVWVETSPAILRYIGLDGKAGYVDYKGTQKVAVKICEYGQAEKLQKELRKQVGELAHGDAKANQANELPIVVPVT